MGTNFYLRGHRGDDDPKFHIGKRSAAGLYCWDCRLTLCPGGEAAVHSGGFDDPPWPTVCPRCGASKSDEPLDKSAAGRELGFNTSPPAAKRGVASCCSWTYAMGPKRICEALLFGDREPCPCCRRPFDDDKVIENEYGDLFSLEEFRKVLAECPIVYTHSIGVEFS